MTQDEIIRMARQSGLGWVAHKRLERFAALVAAHERNRHAWTQEHWTEYEHAIAAAEREACAKVCDEIEQDRWNLYKGRPPYTGKESGRADPHEQGVSMGAGECAAAIRERSANARARSE